jgi:hypothetical protein
MRRMQPIGPDNPGLARVWATRALLLVTISFLIAGGTLAALYEWGIDPLGFNLMQW